MTAPLDRLRDPAPDGPLARLADLILDDALARPAAASAPPGALAAAARDALRAALRSDPAKALVDRAVADAIGRLAADDRAAAELLPGEWVAALRELAARPHSPDRAVVLGVLESEPVRALLRDLLLDALVAFGRKMRAPVTDSGLARGLGGLSRLAADTVARSGSLGALATGMVGAVSQEVEKKLDARAAELAEAAVGKAIGRLADQLCDPARAREQAALRVALLDGALALRGPALAAEAARAGPEEAGEVVRRALLAWLDRDEAGALLAGLTRDALARLGDRPLGEALAALELREPLRAIVRPWLLERLRALVATDAFAAWLAALLGDQGDQYVGAPGPTGRPRRKTQR